MSTPRTLVLLRHGKSDWSGDHDDRHRPLKRRGQRQASEAGRWLATSGPDLELVVVSPARRAADTWALAAAELARTPEVRTDERVYTFDGDDLLDVVRDLPEDRTSVAVVGHNPALEELLHALTGEERPMPTSCLAVVAWTGAWSDAGAGARRSTDLGAARLRAHGRPPAGPLRE